MNSNEHTSAESDFQACTACNYVVRPGDKFCRRCGANLREQSGLVIQGLRAESAGLRRDTRETGTPPPDAYVTAQLAQPVVEPRRYRSVSGPLVNALADMMAKSTAEQLCSPLLKRALIVLSLIPIWLMIVFLSPLDACLAVRSTAAGSIAGQKAPGRLPSVICQQL